LTSDFGIRVLNISRGQDEMGDSNNNTGIRKKNRKIRGTPQVN